MRHFIYAVLCLLIFQSAHTQPFAYTPEEFAKDSARVERLKDNHRRLPQGLYKEIKILDSVLNDICKKRKIQPPERCERARSKLSRIRNQLNRIENDIRIAKEKLDSVDRSLSNIRLTKSPGAYRSYRNLYLYPRIKEYDRLFAKIKRGEKRLLNKAIWYGAKNYLSKDPFPTTVVSLYLEQARKEEVEQKATELDSVKRAKNEWEREIKNLDRQIENLGTRGKILKDSATSLQLARDSIYGERSKLIAHVSQLRKKSNELTEALKEITKELNITRDSMGQIEMRLSLIKDSLDEQTRINQRLTRTNKSLEDSLHMRMDSLKIVTEGLNATRIKLQNTTTKLEEAFDRRELKLLYVALILFLLLALLGQYQRFRNARIGRQKVRAANAKLAAANEQLNDKRAKLESLIGELHHRTKNNLQEISSLLYLQAREKDDENLKIALNEARGRIDAIGIVHRLLYQDKQQKMTAVNVAAYIEELVAHLFKSHHFLKENVRTNFNLQEIYIEADKATQIGLIINELVHNCFKHAFPGTAHPELAVGMTAEDGELQLDVKDNGPGLPAGMKWEESNSFGLKFVRRLVEGRRGTLRYEDKNGAIFKVTLPLKAGEYEIAT